MKNITFALLTLLIISCSSSDDSESIIPIPESYDYFPLNVGAYWTYNNQNSEQENTRDSLFISGTEIIENNSYYQFNALEPVAGFMTSLLSQSSLNANNDELLLNGQFGTPPIEGFPEISIPLVNLIMYDLNEYNGSLLSEISGEILEVIEEIPIKINYQITTIQGETYEDGYGNFTSSSVLSTMININLSIIAAFEVLGTVLEIPILQPQDVIKTTNYFADGIGMIYSDTSVEYQLEDLSILGIILPIPLEDSSNSSQNLDTYYIGN
ncbi:MAG: hypothetical protein EVA38_00685 [Flavobacteriales bacterium]|nr:MAG: hypothetical protein EVA38_00685 [Flavobacteriales bacterium]